MNTLSEWLLQGPPWVQYRTRVDLLGKPENDLQVQAARRAVLGHPQVQALIDELSRWPVRPINSHKDAAHPVHKLNFLADLGLRTSDTGLPDIIDRIMQHQSTAGPLQVLMNIPQRYGGAGKDQWAWALCDAPLLVHALAKFGLAEDRRVQQAARYLAGLVRGNGWPCAVSPELGKFRGPGRKDDPCPYATLAMLKALSQMPEWRDGDACHTGAEALLTLWAQRRERHPYMFYMGTDFCKLKAPLVWYDILHVTDVLTQFPWLRGDARLQEMAGIIESKADADGRFTPESVWKAWDGWDFGQKRKPSPWLTLLALRVMKRIAG